MIVTGQVQSFAQQQDRAAEHQGRELGKSLLSAHLTEVHFTTNP